VISCRLVGNFVSQAIIHIRIGSEKGLLNHHQGPCTIATVLFTRGSRVVLQHRGVVLRTTTRKVLHFLSPDLVVSYLLPEKDSQKSYSFSFSTPYVFQFGP